MYKILVLVLLISFTVEMSIPLFRNFNAVGLLMDTQGTDEKKDNDKKEKEGEAKDKWLSSIKLPSLLEIGTDFFLKNDLVKSLDFLSLPEMPPDRA
jgi:hypothetical protein